METAKVPRAKRWVRPKVPWPDIEVDGEDSKAFRRRLQKHSLVVWNEFLSGRLKLWRSRGCPDDLEPVERDTRRLFGPERFPSPENARKVLMAHGPMIGKVYDALGGLEGLLAAIALSPLLKEEFYKLVLRRAADRKSGEVVKSDDLTNLPGIEELLNGQSGG